MWGVFSYPRSGWDEDAEWPCDYGKEAGQALSRGVGNVVLYPLVISSGAVVPLEIMPDTVRTLSRFLPLTHLVALLRGLWFGQGRGDLLTEVAVLAGLAIVGTLIIAWTFRWE
jgi:ABC-2 type transport system permease protein